MSETGTTQPAPPTETATATQTETTIQQYEAQFSNFSTENTDLLPIVTTDNRDAAAHFSIAISDENGLDTVQAFFDNPQMEERLITEKPINDTSTTLESSVPRRLISPNGSSFIVKPTDQNGKKTSYTQNITPETQSWKVDTPYSNYTTQREWDNLSFDQEQMQNLRNKWNEELLYDQLINDLENGDTQKIQQKYDGDRHVDVEYPNEENTWILSDFRNTENVQDILSYGRNALHVHYEITGESDWSTENDHFAANLEHIANNLHDNNSNDEDIVKTSYVNQGGHGTVIAHANLDNPEIEGEFEWYWIDTTDDWVLPINDPETGIKIDGYNPFIQGYQGKGQITEEASYKSEKTRAETPLLGFFDRDNTQGFNPSPISFSDPVLENIYNEHVPDEQPAEPIIDMVSKAADLQIETGQHVQVYGDSLDYNSDEEVFEGVEYAVNDGELNGMSMSPDTRLTMDKVDSFLEGKAAA